jgi:hypothetical protein
MLAPSELNRRIPTGREVPPATAAFLVTAALTLRRLRRGLPTGLQESSIDAFENLSLTTVIFEAFHLAAADS